MRARLDHVGIAVDGLGDALRFYRDVLGLEVEPVEEVPSQGVRVQFCRSMGDAAGGAARETRLELVAPLDPASAVGRFLERRGPGLHHLALAVEDLRAALAHLKARGVRLVDEEPRPGAHGTLVAFLHPASTLGVLVELVEKGRGRASGDPE